MAAAAGPEPVAANLSAQNGDAPYTAGTPISDVTGDPVFGSYGRLIFPANTGYYSGDMSHKADQNGAPVYAYLFTYGMSFHGAEIPYVFRNTEDTLEEQAMADQLSQVWVSFARTGIPGGDGIPAWEPYTRESGATMLLDTQAELVYHHDRELMNLMAPDYVY